MSVIKAIKELDPKWHYQEIETDEVEILYDNHMIEMASHENEAINFIFEIEENLSFYNEIGLLKLKGYKYENV